MYVIGRHFSSENNIWTGLRGSSEMSSSVILKSLTETLFLASFALIEVAEIRLGQRLVGGHLR